MFSKDVRGIESAHVCQWYCREIYRNKCNWFLYDKKTKDCKLFEGSLMELFDDCRENSYAIDPDFEQCQAVYSSDSEYACEVVILFQYMGITWYYAAKLIKFLFFIFLVFLLELSGRLLSLRDELSREFGICNERSRMSRGMSTCKGLQLLFLF